MFCHPYDTPTFKSNALHLVSNEGWLKCLLLLYMRMANTASPQFSLAITGNAFCHFPPKGHTHFKTKALWLVSNERGLERLLLLYKRIMQPDFSLLWL